MGSVHVQECGERREGEGHAQEHVGVAQHLHRVIADTSGRALGLGSRIGSLRVLNAESSVFHCHLRL